MKFSHASEKANMKSIIVVILDRVFVGCLSSVLTSRLVFPLLDVWVTSLATQLDEAF